MGHHNSFGSAINSFFSTTMKITFFYISFCLLGAHFAVATREDMLNPIMNITREELVKIAGYGEDKLSTVLITGTVLCEESVHFTTGDDEARIHNIPDARPVSGALVAVSCQMGDSRRSRPCWTNGITDENGDFSIDLPSHLHATPSLHKKCSVGLLRIPKNSKCGPLYLHGHRRIELLSVGDGIRTYSSGIIRLVKPIKRRKHFQAQARVQTSQGNGLK